MVKERRGFYVDGASAGKVAGNSLVRLVWAVRDAAVWKLVVATETAGLLPGLAVDGQKR